MAEPHSGRRALVFGVVLLAPIVLGGLAAPWLAPYPPNEQIDQRGGAELPPLSQRWLVELASGEVWLVETLRRTGRGLEVERLGQTVALDAAEVRNLDADGVTTRRFFILGTDKFSRDVLSRLLYATRLSLLIGACSIILMMAIGITVGTLAALGGRILDAILMRLVDGLLAFPWFFLLITLAALLRVDVWTLVLVIGMSGWMSISRLTRAEIQSLAERDFVLAARALGAGPVRIFFRHLLPHAATPLIVQAAVGVATVVATEAALSFLGFGVQPPDASWGNLIQDGRANLAGAWWVSTFPALALVSTVIGLNLIGDGLRDLLDPRYHPGAERD